MEKLDNGLFCHRFEFCRLRNIFGDTLVCSNVDLEFILDLPCCVLVNVVNFIAVMDDLFDFDRQKQISFMKSLNS